MQDLLLAILVEQEPIKLAPSSSQIPALLAKTKQNIFDVRAQQQASHRYQQRFQQQRPGSGTTASRDTVMGDSLRRDSQVSAPGQPSLLPTASGVNLPGEGPQDNAPQQGVSVLNLPFLMRGCNPIHRWTQPTVRLCHLKLVGDQAVVSRPSPCICPSC